MFFSDECTVPAIEVLVKCIHGLNVNKQCIKKIYQVTFMNKILIYPVT